VSRLSGLVPSALVAVLAGRGLPQESRPAALAALETPGRVLHTDGFESDESLRAYFEIRGADEGRVRRTTDPEQANSGSGALRLTSPANEGNASGAGVSYWFGPEGEDRVHLRVYVRFAADYDQGNLHHTGASLAGVAGTNKWGGMGTAGLRPRGDDHFSSSLETWREWGRFPAPGFPVLYAYWMDMRRDRDGNFWGNLFEPPAGERVALERNRWICLEHMIRVNDVGQANGEHAAWIDGRLVLHATGIRWRSDAGVRLKRFGLDVYVHRATKENAVWFDDVVLSTGYVGPLR